MYLLMSEMLYRLKFFANYVSFTLIQQSKLTLTENALLCSIHDCLAK